MRYKGHDFQVGEVVRFRQWDDMKAEFGLDNRGSIHIPGRPTFVSDMRPLCGTRAVIGGFETNHGRWLSHGLVKLKDFEIDGGHIWAYCLEMLKPVEEEYHFNEREFLSMIGGE